MSRKTDWRSAIIFASIVLLALSHWLSPRPDKQFHNLLYHLDFIPILMAGTIFGWRHSILATCLTLAAEFPLAWKLWSNDHIYLFDQLGETTVFGVAGVVVGYMSQRERRQRSMLEKTKSELEGLNTELQQNMVRLQKAERMFAVAQLSASMAHEIRNPLASISGAAGILKRGHASSENVAECLDIIDKESQRLNKLLTHFLEFARPRAPRLQPTDLASVIESVISIAGRAPEAADITFLREIDPALPEVDCDPEQLKQVLLNLARNAVQANGHGSVRFHAYLRPGCALIAVSDQGGGIPADQENRIFDPFFTTKEGGTGLGLAIASKIIEQHGGSLSADNRPGHGLTIIVQLPLGRTLANGSAK